MPHFPPLRLWAVLWQGHQNGCVTVASSWRTPVSNIALIFSMGSRVAPANLGVKSRTRCFATQHPCTRSATGKPYLCGRDMAKEAKCLKLRQSLLGCRSSLTVVVLSDWNKWVEFVPHPFFRSNSVWVFSLILQPESGKCFSEASCRVCASWAQCAVGYIQYWLSQNWNIFF